MKLHNIRKYINQFYLNHHLADRYWEYITKYKLNPNKDHVAAFVLRKITNKSIEDIIK